MRSRVSTSAASSAKGRAAGWAAWSAGHAPLSRRVRGRPARGRQASPTVAASLHSRNNKYSYFAPGTLTTPPAAPPKTIADLPEGDTLAFQVTAGNGGPSMFLMGASDFPERAAGGLRPDLAMVAVPSSTVTHRYVSRLLRALGGPDVVVPVHWDNFEEPLGEPPRRDPSMDLDGFLAQVHRESPASRIAVPDYRTVYGGACAPAPDKGGRAEPRWTLGKKLVTLREPRPSGVLSDSEGFPLLFAQRRSACPVAGSAVTWITSKANISPIRARFVCGGIRHVRSRT